jgi:hypothetical protein
VAWLVVARNLGGDSLQSWLTGRGWPATRYASQKGYRLLRVDNPKGENPGDENPQDGGQPGAENS